MDSLVIMVVIFMAIGGMLTGYAAGPSKKSRLGIALLGTTLLIFTGFMLGAITPLGGFIRDHQPASVDLTKIIR